MGTLTAGSGNQLVGGGKYVTQSSGITADSAVWTFTWTAPPAGTGEVTFYGAFAITTGTTELSSLGIPERPTQGIGANGTPGDLVAVTPNPSTGRFNLAFGKQVTQAVTINVYDVSGQIRYTGTTQSSDPGKDQTIDLTSQAAGVYILEVLSGNSRQVLRLVKSE